MVYTRTVASSACGNTENCVNTPTTILSYAAHTWKVRAMVDGVWRAYSATRAFSIVVIPTAAAPSAAIQDTTPSFTWSKVDRGTRYQYQLYKGAALVYTKTVLASACGSTENCVNTPTKLLASGAYTWRVRAMASGIWQPFSAANTFTIP